jgi:hypothetical protein
VKWLAAAALLALAIWEIATLLHVHAAAPADADWDAAAAFVRAGFAPGDLVVFAPEWSDPVGRLHLGDLLTIHDAARMDAARYGRIWEVSQRGATAADADGPVGLEREFGALRVRRHDHSAARVTWDLRDRAKLLEVGYAPRECVEVRAPSTLDVGSVPLASRLVVRAGLADFRARRDNRATALVRVLVDGAEAASAEIGSESGWVALPPIATTPGAHRVAFETRIAGGGQPAILPACIAAEARDEAPPP